MAGSQIPAFEIEKPKTALELYVQQIGVFRSKLMDFSFELEKIGGDSRRKRIAQDMIFGLEAEITELLREFYRGGLPS